MSKRVNNHKGWPSKNKMHNRRRSNIQAQKDKLLKMKEGGKMEKMINEKGKALFDKLNRQLKSIAKRGFLRRHQGR